jgi:hypothetical protein
MHRILESTRRFCQVLKLLPFVDSSFDNGRQWHVVGPYTNYLYAVFWVPEQAAMTVAVVPHIDLDHPHFVKPTDTVAPFLTNRITSV